MKITRKLNRFLLPSITTIVVLSLVLLLVAPVIAENCPGIMYEEFNNAAIPDYSPMIYLDGKESTMQVFEAESTHYVNYIRLPLFSENSVPLSIVYVYLYEVVDIGADDWIPDTLLTYGTYDYALIAAWANWDWYCVPMNNAVEITVGNYYGIVVSFWGEEFAPGENELLYWVVDLDEWHNFLFYTVDNGTTWTNWNSRDAMYELYYNEPIVPADAMFEVWGEADPPYGVFIAAVPALFKLAVLLGTILAAILVLRGKRPTGLGGGYG